MVKKIKVTFEVESMSDYKLEYFRSKEFKSDLSFIFPGDKITKVKVKGVR